MRRRHTGLSPAQAVALGVLHGPTELLPVSSSAHTSLVPWLAGWRYARLDGATRKSFEVALHAGTAVALPFVTRPRLRPLFLACATAPPALAGVLGEQLIERRLGGPRATAIGLLAGAAAMTAADLLASDSREAADVGPIDGLALGIAQAAALWPGLSRTGMTLAAARARGFGRDAAWTLSREAALPILVGAAAWKARRLGGEGLRGAFAAGAVAAFASTLAAAPLTRIRAIAPFAAERVLLAGLVLRRL